MSDTVLLLLACGAGLLLGVVFFWGLWLTVNGLESAEHPVRRVLSSLLLRFGVVIGGFYLLAGLGSWQTVVAGGAGFVFARFLVIRRTRARSLDIVSRGSDA
jgi:F1F0 ATPase subunit 2